MRSISRPISRLALSTSLVAGTAFSASADLPDLLDRIAADAPVVIAIPDSGSLLTGARAFLNKIGQGQAAMGLGMATGILDTPGVGRGAIVIVLPETFNPQMGEEPEPVFLVQLDDLEQAFKSFGGRAVDGVFEMNMFGSNVFARDLGDGVAIVGPERDGVVSYVAAKDMAATHQKRLGMMGGELLGSNQIVIAANFNTFADGALELYAQGKQQAMGMAMMLGPAAGVLQDESIDQVVTAFMRQTEAGMIGLTFTPDAVALDLAANFKAGSEIAGFFADSGSTEGLLSRVPNGDFLYAHAIDTRSKGLAKLTENAKEFSAKLNEAMGQGGGGANAVPDLFETGKTGEAFYVGQTPGGLQGGVLSRATRYVRTDDAKGAMENAADATAKMVNSDMGGPFLLTGSWQAGAAEVDGVSAARWSIGIKPKPGDPNAMQVMSGLSMLFGPTAGPAGFAAPARGGVIQTMSAGNIALLSEALTAASENNGLATGERLGVASGMLPENRYMEYYINTGSILQSVRGLVGIFLPPLPFELPESLTPVGGSLSSGGGGMSTRLVLPADVVKFSIEAGQAIEAQNAGQGGNRGNEGPPRF